MDLGLCKFESIKIKSSNESVSDKYGFILYKTNRIPRMDPALLNKDNSPSYLEKRCSTIQQAEEIHTSMVFVAENYIDYQSWRKALESYVVQTINVQNVYKMSDQLGKGSHA